MKKLFLLDAYALIFRAYYALIRAPRFTRDGFNTSAIFGFVNTLEELFRKENPTHMAVCFDPPGPTFRNEAYEKYKAERSETPEDIRRSIPIIKEIVKAYNIPVVEVPGYEADDVIGTLAMRAAEKDFTVYMMTPDKDFGQLVGSNVLQYKPSYRGQDFELRGEEEVKAKYGIQSPKQVIDLLALMGDKIDNIPGCPGIGEVGAVKLITQFGSVENLLANVDSLKGATKRKVEENAELISFSKFLATICTDVPVDIDLDQLVCSEPDRDKLFAIFREMEFRQLADRVNRRLDAAAANSPSSPSSSSPSPNKAPSLFDDSDFNDSPSVPAAPALPRTDTSDCLYKTVSDLETLDSLQSELAPLSQCGLFILADGENDATSQWIGSAIAVAPCRAYYIPASFKEGCAAVMDLMARPDIQKVSCDAKRDWVVAARHRGDDAPALQNFYDVALAHYVLQPEMRHAVDLLALSYLNLETMSYPGKVTTTRRGSKTRSSQNADPALLANWACQQADASLRLFSPLSQAVEAENMKHLLDEIELPLVPVLADMELTGVNIDVQALEQAEKDLQNRLDNIEKKIFQLVDEPFNVGSPAKVGEILFEKLQLDPKAKKTKTGQFSTSEDILEKLMPKHPVVALIMEWRALKKLITTYLAALPAAINPATGRVHTNYNQTVTATGRISSSAPNLQNIPIRDDEGREIRRAFIPQPGNLFLSADYSQIELRLLADFSGDETMLDAFRHGKDIHAITAAKIYHKPVEEVTANERRNAKTANFGIAYGISAFGLSTRLGIPRAEAKEIIDNYFLTFPAVRQYISDSIENAKEKGYVETRMHRRRMLPDIRSHNATVRGYAERNAINAPLQGTAADIIKIAMIRIYNEIKQRGLKSKMIMQVHDELNFNVPPDEVGTMQELVTRQMENAYQGSVTLTTSSGIATNWLDAH